MRAVTILPEVIDGSGTLFRAISDGMQGTGKSAGEALDSLTARLDPADRGTLVIVQSFSPDRYFSNEQRHRLSHLMGKWRAARDTGRSLPVAEQSELEALTQAEQDAALKRTRQLGQELEP